ncbi:MAG: serine/threonine protein kinase [Bacteroidaceae bacterium]|nr:serine/threonine protein kinase [Bacteroidaceae bacterium]
MHLPIGTLLQGGRYEIISYISSGGFGCTYEARDTKFKSSVKSVAVKEFFVKDFCNRDAGSNRVVVATQSKVELVNKLRDKFLEEADALFELEHPNIVRVTDTFKENGTAYYVMEYIRGTSLAAVIEKEGALSEEKAFGYIRQIADALEYVHSLNRLHLDVKPQNIMIDNSGKAVLIDFGVSKQYDEANGENTSTLIGSTPGFAPIEQSGNGVSVFTPATDIYSLGATLYKALTGETPIEAYKRAGDDDLKELPYPMNISPAMRNVIDRSMHISRGNRPQSIGEFLALFEQSTNYDDGRTLLDVDASFGNKSEKVKWMDFVQFCDENRFKLRMLKWVSFVNNRYWLLALPLQLFILYFTIIGILLIPVFLVYFFSYRLVISKVHDIEDTPSLYKMIRSEDGLYGLSKWGKKSSRERLEMKYEYISRISDDMFIVKSNSKYGLYNATKREMIIPIGCEKIELKGDRILATKEGTVSVYTDRGYRVVE